MGLVPVRSLPTVTHMQDGRIIVERLEGEAVAESWEFPQAVVKIGRRADNDIVLGSERWPAIAAYHLQLQRDRGHLQVTAEEGAHNQWSINGGAGASGALLGTQDRLRIGSDGPILRARVAAGVAPAAAPAAYGGRTPTGHGGQTVETAPNPWSPQAGRPRQERTVLAIVGWMAMVAAVLLVLVLLLTGVIGA